MKDSEILHNYKNDSKNCYSKEIGSLYKIIIKKIRGKRGYFYSIYLFDKEILHGGDYSLSYVKEICENFVEEKCREIVEAAHIKVRI